MLQFLKGRPKEQEPAATPTEPVLFEGEKERSFRDPKTGEFIYQRAITPEQRKSVFTAFQENASLANQLIGLCRQSLSLEEQTRGCNKQITDSEKKINDHIIKIRDELKLDPRWSFNMQLGCMERRDPPVG